MSTTEINEILEKLLKKSVQVFSLHHAGGGEMNQAYKVLTDSGSFFLKIHPIKNYPRFFEKEKTGLKVLQEANCIDVCSYVGTLEYDNYSFFVLNFIDSAPMVRDFWAKLGKGIAELHKVTNTYFGFIEDNYLGQCLQINHRMSNWGQFFVKNRLLPNVRACHEKHYLELEDLEKFEHFFKLVEFAFPEEQPSLLHGDLWKEHIVTNDKGEPCLINPAVYYGHREMDIAMTSLVGEFPAEFYQAYHENFPLKEGWEDRQDFCKMYYQLAKLNVYGVVYLDSVRQILNKWVTV